MGLSEIRRDYDNQTEQKNGYILMHSAAEKGNYGTGFIIKNRLKNNIIEFVAKSSRIVYLKLKIKKKNFTILQLHAPTTGYPIEVIEDFYNTLSEIIYEVCSDNEELIVMGDFNARIGTQIPGEEHLVGPHSTGKRNKSGDVLKKTLQHHIIL